jgi:hypothetical protein
MTDLYWNIIGALCGIYLGYSLFRTYRRIRTSLQYLNARIDVLQEILTKPDSPVGDDELLGLMFVDVPDEPPYEIEDPDLEDYMDEV